MALATLNDLKTSIATWMARSDMGVQADDFITLAEARLNRELDPVELDATISAVPSSREIDVAAQSVETPLALFLNDPAIGNERPVQQQAPGTFPFITDNGAPWIWSLDGTKIVFDRPAYQAYTFRFRFTQRFRLSNAAPTNWLLTNHPDVYLSAVLVWGNILKRSSDDMRTYASMLEEGLAGVRNEIAQTKRGTLRVDPALSSIGRCSFGV